MVTNTVNSCENLKLAGKTRYPLLSGLYRLLKLAILLAKRSGFFQSNELAFDTHLQSFAHFLIGSFSPLGALSADDLTVARSSCLLSFPLSVLGHSNITRIGLIIASISQLVNFQGRCASLAIETASAVEEWLKETKADSPFNRTAFSALVPALINLLNANSDEPVRNKSAFPIIGRCSYGSHPRTEWRRALKAISRPPIALNADSLIREAQIKVIELIGLNALHWNLLNMEEISEEACDKFVEILPTEKGVFNDLYLYLPFPDLRPRIRLSDLRLLTRVLYILLWRPRSSKSLNNEISKGFSRQTRVCAAEYIHEYIVFGLNNQRAASSDPTEPIENSDASFWQLLFQLVFILGADDDPLIRRLFRSLAFQLVHWYAGYPIAGFCESKLLQKTLLRILKLISPEDDICGVIESTWPIPESVDTLRIKLASICLRDFLHWMNSESLGTKRRRSSLVDERLDDLLRQILDGLCREGSASVVFVDVVAPLLAERPELTRKYIYVLIDAFKRPGKNFSPIVLKRAFDLMIGLIKQSPEDLVFEDYSTTSKRPRLTRASQNKPNIDSLIPVTWEHASVSSCVKSFFKECQDSPNRKLFQELIEQVLSAANLQLIPQILSDSESLVSIISSLISNVKVDIGLQDLFSHYINKKMCQDVLITLKAASLSIAPDVISKLIQSVFTISAFFKYQVNDWLRMNQLCEGITSVWKRRIEPLLLSKDFDIGLFVDLLEAIISLSQVELDRNIFISAFLHLLKDEALNISAKVKNLDMLAFFLQSDITPTNFTLSNERLDEIVEAVKYLIASNLPLDPDEVTTNPVQLAECSTVLKSILSLLETLSCPEAIRMLMMTFCRYDDHFMDEKLEESLRSAMKRIWTRPLNQEQLLTSALNYFEQAFSSANPSSAFINLWHRYIHKFLKPLLLSVSPSILERLAVRNIAKWIQIFEGNTSGDGVNVTQWLWRLLNRSLTFYLLVTIYNRLPKTVLNGLTAGGSSGPAKSAINAPLINELESTAKTLKRTLWHASLACLVAAISATQTQEKALSYILFSDPLSRFLPDKSFTFPRHRSGKYRSAFIELREQFWLPSERESYFNKINVESQGTDSSSRQGNKSGGLLLESSFSVEINRFMRASGTQIIRGSTSSTDFKKPLSPRVSPLSSTTSSDFRQIEEMEAEPNYVNLEVDPLNMTSLMITFVGLLKHMSRLDLLKPSRSNDIPQIIKFLYDQFNSNRANDNVRAFVVKLVINCPEAFKPFSKYWFPLLLTYASSNTEALLDSSGLSSLTIEMCLLLADWSRSNILPTTEMEKTAAEGLLAFLVKHAWIRVSEDGEPDIIEGIVPALKHNLELIQLLAESWLPAGVRIPYRDLLAELQSRVDNKRTIFALHLFKTILISCQRFIPKDENLPLSQFVSALLQHIHQTQKTLLTATWECSALLASKCFIEQSFTTSAGEFLRSRGLNILPLSTFPKDLHPLINELWSIVAESNTVYRRKRAINVPITSVIEAACTAAFHWSVLALHLTNSLLGTGIPESIGPNSFVNCLRMFTKLIEDFNENKLGFALEQTAKIEVLQSIINSNVFEMIKLGNTVILFHGTMLILRMVQFMKNIPQNNRDFDMETRNGLVLRFLRFLLSTLTRSNSTPDSRRIAYRIFIEARRNEKSTENRELMEICYLGLSYGLCAENDDQLRRQLRKYVSGHCFDSSPIPGLFSSLSRCLQTFQLLSSGHCGSTDDPTLVSSIGRHLISTSLEIVLEPAIKSAEFRNPFRKSPLDPHYPFTDAGFSRTSISISQSLLDPVVHSVTQKLKRSQTQLLETALVSATLSFPGGDSTQTQLLETQQIPSTSPFTQFGETPSDQSVPKQVSFSVKSRRKVKKVDFKNLSPVEKLRRKFSFAATLAAQNPDSASRSGNSIREFFKKRNIQRQHAETSIGTSSLSLTEHETSTRLCRRHRIGALPDVEKITPEALLKPLFQLAKSDSSICGPVLLGLVLESIVVSSGKGVDDGFVKELGASLAGLLTRGGVDQSIVCLSLIWELGSGLEREGIILSMIPEPTILTASAISAEKPMIGVLIMEEAFCNLVMRCTPYESSSLSPWTSKRRRFYASSMPIFILPQEEIEVVSFESDTSTSKITAATFWWQLTRLYLSIGRSEEILGWLCDRWTSGSDSIHLLERLGRAIVTKGFGDYEGAALQLKEILQTFTDENESELEDSSRMDIEDSDVSNLWTPEVSGLNTELRLVCREELLHCLNRLGSWKDLDIYAVDSARYIGVSQADDSSHSLDEASTLNILDDEFAALWKEPYLADSILPQVVHSRLQICLSSEINKTLSNQHQEATYELSNFASIMDSGLLSTSQDVEPKYAYELALLSILREDLSKAQFYCKEAFKHLAHTWSSEEDKEKYFERVQLITELKEYLEASRSGLDSDAALKLLILWQERCSKMKCSEEIINSRLFYLSKLKESGKFSLAEKFLPASIDFRLKCCGDFSRSGNAKRAINSLPQIHQLIRKIGNNDEYRRLAWCNAFSRAWITEYLKNAVYCFEEERSSVGLENGLGQCLSSLSQCIDVYESLRTPTSPENVDLNIVQFSHAISIAQVLSAFHDLSVSGRLSDSASNRLTSLLQPTLKARFVKIHGLEELEKADDFLQASALAFFKRCVDLAMGVLYTESKGDNEPVSVEKTLCRQNLIVYKPDEALLEVANFCNNRIDEETANRDSYIETFSRSVLTAMRMGSEGGRIHFGRVLQLEVARCSTSPSTYDANLFRDLTKNLSPWMFSQWFDRLLMAPLEGGLCLVNDILRRIATKFPQSLFLPFRVLSTSFCDWNFVGQSSFEYFITNLMNEGKSDVAVFYSEIHNVFSKLVNLSNFIEQLEYFDEPDLVFKDWVNNYAKKTIRSSNFNPTDLANACNTLLKGGFLRLPPNPSKIEIVSEVGNPQTERQMAVTDLSNLIHNEFGKDCNGLLTITPAEFDIAVRGIMSTYKKTNRNCSKLTNYSHWLANYSSDGRDCIEMPGQRLESSSSATKRLITIERIDPNVTILMRLGVTA
ncbi:hypothetical protein ACTXT7_004923 [Hymenolepis weldensis]